MVCVLNEYLLSERMLTTSSFINEWAWLGFVSQVSPLWLQVHLGFCLESGF